MRQAAYAAMAYALKERYAAARNQARQKVLQLAGDLAAILAHEDPAFDSVAFYRDGCHFTGDDIAEINGQRREVVYSMLARSAADPGENETHQGYKNYETFTVCVWLDNDRELQDDSVTVALNAAEGEEFPDVRAAEALREWIESKHLTEKRGADVEDMLSGVANTLLNAALGEVDWLEVARTRLGIAAKYRLEAIRAALRAENISYGELAELESLAPYIEPGDVELLEAAGVPEHDED